MFNRNLLETASFVILVRIFNSTQLPIDCCTNLNEAITINFSTLRSIYT